MEELLLLRRRNNKNRKNRNMTKEAEMCKERRKRDVVTGYLCVNRTSDVS
jgi:hypothetical protein